MIDIKEAIITEANKRSEEEPMSLYEIAELAEMIQNQNIEELIASHDNFKDK